VQQVLYFNNKDSGMPHNFSVYQTLAGGQTKPVFIGNTIVGPSNLLTISPHPQGPARTFLNAMCIRQS
jgi:hypothetical protein